MKIKVSQKQIKENYKNIICVGYCDLWHLLRGQEERFYTSGINGWNADIYQINYNTVIVTGYRPFGNINTNYKINNKYEERAREILNNHNIEYNKRINKINKLLEKYIKELIKE